VLERAAVSNVCSPALCDSMLCIVVWSLVASNDGVIHPAAPVESIMAVSRCALGAGNPVVAKLALPLYYTPKPRLPSRTVELHTTRRKVLSVCSRRRYVPSSPRAQSHKFAPCTHCAAACGVAEKTLLFFIAAE